METNVIVLVIAGVFLFASPIVMLIGGATERTGHPPYESKPLTRTRPFLISVTSMTIGVSLVIALVVFSAMN